MPAYKDQERGTWYIQFYYQDWTDERKKKLKRGFRTKKEAQAWERSFLEKQQANPDMSFDTLIQLYLEDMATRLRLNTMETKRHMINRKLLPFFASKPINSIIAADIRKWQNTLISDPKQYSKTYLKTINNQLVAILNYAVKYYGLKENPCHKAGPMGKKNAEEMHFWTKDEYLIFRDGIVSKPVSIVAFDLLYWTGIRIGELMALTLQDFDFQNKAVTVNKSYQRLNKQDIITEPKTPKGKRSISLPQFICDEVQGYISTLYKPADDDRIFRFTKHYLRHEMVRGC